MTREEELAILGNIIETSSPEELKTRIKKETTLCDSFGCSEDCDSCIQKYLDWYKKYSKKEV